MKAAIISLNFHPGHFSHLGATYALLDDLNIDPIMYLHQNFLKLDTDNNYNKVVNFSLREYKKFDLAIFWFPSLKNFHEILKFRFLGSSKIIYVFHEPIDSYKAFYKAGFRGGKFIKLFFVDIFNVLMILLSSQIILPSKKAETVYIKKYKKFNSAYYQCPLLFDDESADLNPLIKRKYISYIGTIAKDHSYDEFVEFVNYCISNNLLLDYVFQIATKSIVQYNEIIKINEESGRLKIHHGKPMTNEEINLHYRESYIVWNAYFRSTQSGVLAKSFMFGTPVIVLRKNKSEFSEDGRDVVAIEDNKNKEEILKSIKKVLNDFDSYSHNARKSFEKNFYYKSQFEIFRKLLQS